MANILLIDDEPEFSAALSGQLHEAGHEVRWLDFAEDGLRLLTNEAFDLVLLDNKMPRMSGLEFLKTLKERGVYVPVILMTSAHNDQTVIEAIKNGAFDYVIKPLSLDGILPKLLPVMTKALEITRRPKAVPLPRPDQNEADDDSVIVARSEPMLEVLKQIARLATVDESVLILGETGTGKGLVATAIHTNSARKNQPFVVINCAALNENLLTSELFGHERGAFTGADKIRKGRFEHAHGGTLFLDEVGDMPLSLQAMLLRVLENRVVERVGSSEPIPVDVRVLAATHRDLNALVREGKFRQDLFYRLEGMTIHLPALRERPEDIEILARRFLSRMFGGAAFAPVLHADAVTALRNHSWPGNIRQLQKVLGRATGIARGSQITAADLDFGELDAGPAPTAVDEASARAGLRRAIAWAWDSERPDLWPFLQQHLESELLRYAIAQPGLSQVQLARKLGMARNTLRARLKQYGLEDAADGDA